MKRDISAPKAYVSYVIAAGLWGKSVLLDLLSTLHPLLRSSLLKGYLVYVALSLYNIIYGVLFIGSTKPRISKSRITLPVIWSLWILLDIA